MSKRTAVLCDKMIGAMGSWGKEPAKPGHACPKMAIGKCPLCDDDVCEEHALHPKGGLSIELKLTGVNTQTQPPMDSKLAVATHAVFVCGDCGRKATQGAFDHSAQEIVDMVATNIRAQFTVKAMGDK